MLTFYQKRNLYNNSRNKSKCQKQLYAGTQLHPLLALQSLKKFFGFELRKLYLFKFKTILSGPDTACALTEINISNLEDKGV